MSKSKVTKTIMTLLVTCMMLVTNVFSVSAHEIETPEIIMLNNIEKIELYNGADGIYEARLDDGSRIRVTIKTSDIVESEISTYATEYTQNKSYNYEYLKSNGNLDWSSEVAATFHYNNTYAWCTEGIAYHKFGDSSNNSILYSLNSYSSAKVTDVSKYQIKAKIKTSTGTYDISQYVGSDPTGKIYFSMSF
jgi:hypothetical protein